MVFSKSYTPQLHLLLTSSSYFFFFFFFFLGVFLLLATAATPPLVSSSCLNFLNALQKCLCSDHAVFWHSLEQNNTIAQPPQRGDSLAHFPHAEHGIKTTSPCSFKIFDNAERFSYALRKRWFMKHCVILIFPSSVELSGKSV